MGTRSFQLGRSYFEDEAVFDLRRQGDALKALCQGSMPQPYRLRVAFGAEGIEGADCSCPVGGGGHCKHVGALLLAWLDRPDAFRAVPELDADLERRGKDELIALIKQMLRLQPRPGDPVGDGSARRRPAPHSGQSGNLPSSGVIPPFGAAEMIG